MPSITFDLAYQIDHTDVVIFDSKQNTADVAQLVEQLIRNEQAWGSSPHIGSSSLCPPQRDPRH